MEENPQLKSEPQPHAEAPKVSARKLEANRKNALKSTGPKSIRGKGFSRRNATKHGILSRDLVIEEGTGKESLEEFQQLFAELIEDLKPQGRTELSLVETVAISDWRFRRALRAEGAEIASGASGAVNSALPPPYMTDMLLRYQTAIHKQKMAALHLLQELQKRRGTDSANRDATEK